MVLSTRQLRVLQAAMDRIVPSDTDPGAWDSGCGAFLSDLLEHQLVDPEIYSNGLDCLENEAQKVFHNGFSQLTTDEQDDLLSSVEVGSVFTHWTVLPGQFFRTLVKNTMEGYYGHHSNGGHSTAAAWRMIGFEVTG